MTKKKHPGGRPTKFSAKVREVVELLANRGFTDAEMAVCLDVTEQTLNNWKKKHPKFFESLKDWKLTADEKVVKSLYERACGYSCPETKAQFIQDKEGGRWESAEMIKHYPPDTTSMIFWLKNRQPDRWRDKQLVGVGVRLEDVLAALPKEFGDAVRANLEKIVENKNPGRLYARLKT